LIFYSNIICLKEKNRVIVNDDIRELLVYYSFLWIEEGYKMPIAVFLPNQILEDYFVKLKAAISDNKYYNGSILIRLGNKNELAQSLPIHPKKIIF